MFAHIQTFLFPPEYRKRANIWQFFLQSTFALQFIKRKLHFTLCDKRIENIWCKTKVSGVKVWSGVLTLYLQSWGLVSKKVVENLSPKCKIIRFFLLKKMSTHTPSWEQLVTARPLKLFIFKNFKFHVAFLKWLLSLVHCFQLAIIISIRWIAQWETRGYPGNGNSAFVLWQMTL